MKMKQIIAIIKPHRLERVEQALHRLEHFPGFTFFQSHGQARGSGSHHAYAATEWNPDAHDSLVLLMYCDDVLTPQVVEAIRLAAHTGNPGDGMIAVSDLENIVRIRTGERDDDAV
jgi:nitrogen regulatory protein P-II 1